MKNLKKVLALVVALTMVLGTVAFAGYTDVAEDASEYTAVSTLSSLGILTGYEDGSFNPTGDITRAEFCAVVCRALGAKVSGAAVTGFSDVAADHWASAYISYVAGLGIVNGMGDGTFAPDANVTFEQAVKMLVVALGFEPMAAQKGGYPTGYMVVANTYGITEAIAAVQDAAASRAVVAQLVYNALDVPMMDQTGFGTQISYEILDGTGDKAYKTLLTGLDVTKLDGNVVKTSIIGSPAADKGYVDFKITDDYDSDDFAVGQTKTFAVAEGVDAEGYFGFASTVFVKEYAKNKYEIIAIMPGAESQVMELGAEDIADITTSYIEYYTDADKYDTKKVNLEATANSAGTYLNNDDTKVLADIKARVQAGGDVEIKLIDNNANNRYDIVFAEEYFAAVVDSVEANKGRFTCGLSKFKFDFEDESKNITIVDKNGDAISLEDFEEGDVIAYMHDASLSTYSWIKVINLGKNAVEGTITEKESTAIYVDGVRYEEIYGPAFKLGTEGKFFLTRTGKIFDYEKSASVAGNYGYVLGADILPVDGGWDEAWHIQILTKDNEVKTFIARDGFTVNGVEGIDQAATSAGVLSTTLKNTLSANSDASTRFKVNPRARLVTYSLDSKGLLKEITNPTTSVPGTDIYNADAEKLFTSFETDAIIFNLSGSSANNAYVTGVASLIDDNQYTGFYASNDESEVDCLVITAGNSPIDYAQDLAIITSVTTTKHNEEDAKKVRYYVSGEDAIKEIIIMQDPTVSVADAGTSYGSIAVGDLMMFTDDGNGVASAYAKIAATAFLTADQANTSGATPYTSNSGLINAINSDATNDVEIVVGFYIDDYDKVSKGVKIVADNGESYVLTADTNVYTLKDDASSNKFRVYAGEWDALEVDKDTDAKANYFIAKIVDDKVADFITFASQCRK